MSAWGKVPREAFTDGRLTRRDLRVFGVICNRAHWPSGSCTVKQADVADEIGTDRVGVLRSLKKLVDLGYLSAQPRPGMRRSLQYRVLMAERSLGQMNLFDANEAPRQARKEGAKGGRTATSDVASDATSDVALEATSLEQTLNNRTEPAGSSAKPRERMPANDHRPSAAVPSEAKTRAGPIPPGANAVGAVPSVVGSEADAVPFLAPAGPASADRQASRDLEHRLRDAAGASINAASVSLCDLSAVFRWIAAGCDIERDILPTVAGRAARHRGSLIRAWSYFEQAVLEAVRQRRAIEDAMAAPAGTVIPIEASPSWSGRFAAAAEKRRREFADGGDTRPRESRFAAIAEQRRREFAARDGLDPQPGRFAAAAAELRDQFAQNGSVFDVTLDHNTLEPVSTHGQKMSAGFAYWRDRLAEDES